jgi:hypothetical protein
MARSVEKEIADLQRSIDAAKEALDECDDREDRQSIRDLIERMRDRQYELEVTAKSA